MRPTVAVCTWNRCEVLRQTLEQMTHLAIPAGVDWELLVVNNNCTDETDEVIAALEQMAAYLRAKTGAEDEVMSGGVIWELQALRRPFHNISHPLTFEDGISKEQAAAVTLDATRRPPKVIILDGYTDAGSSHASRASRHPI